MVDFARFAHELYPQWEALYRSGGGTGEYSFQRGGPTSLYGTTDILFCRAIMNDLNISENDRSLWAATINAFQLPHSGWYRKTYTWTHPREHTTAYALAALTLLGRAPRYAMRWVPAMLTSFRARRRWLAGVPWSVIWMGSHILAGRPAIMAMTGEMTAEFRDWYFEWLDAHVDPRTGFWMRGAVHRLGLVSRPTRHEMGGAFHMFFLYEHFNRAWRYPERAIDNVLRLQRPNGFWDGDYTYCIDLDAVYCLTRSARLAPGYRTDEIRAAVARYLKGAALLLNDAERLFAFYRYSHQLPGALAAVAECRKWYPDMVSAPAAWVQTLDYAPYI